MIRLAGQAMKGLGNAGKFLFKGMNKGDIALRLIPDAAIGTMVAAQTPGDAFDKLVAGGSSALGGGIGGLALGRLAGGNQAVGTLLDMAGSYGGDYAGMVAADSLMRGKDSLMGGYGQTPYERMAEAQQQQMAEQIRKQMMSEMYGVNGLS